MLDRHRLVLTLLLAFAWGAPAHAQSPARAPGMLLSSPVAEAELLRGREAVLAFRLGEGEETFRRLFLAGGNDLPAYYHLTGIAFIQAMFRQDEPAYDHFFARSDSLYEMLKGRDDSAWQSFFRSELFLMRAFVRARRGDFFRAAVAAKESYESYIATLRHDPTLIDAERGIGVLKTIIGATPSAYRRFLRILGYKGSIDEGIRLLRHAAEKGRYCRDESSLFLALTQVFLNVDQEEGLATLSDHYAKHRDPLTGLLYTFSLRLVRRPDEAVEVARASIDTMHTPAHTDVEFLYYHLGGALFSLNRFEEAAVAYEQYIRSFDGQSYQAGSRLRLGLSLEMLDRREEAERWYAEVEAPTDFDTDQAAQHEARERRKDPLTETDKILLRGQNAVGAGKNEDAVSILEPVFFSSQVDQIARTEAAYHMGRAYHLLKRLDEAATKYVYVRTHPVDDDVRWAPWATYYLAKVRVETGQIEEARTLLQEAIDFKGKFDYKKSLQRSAKLALDALQ